MANNIVYTPFGSDDIVQSIQNRITRGMWSDGEGILTSFYTESAAIPSADSIYRYYIDVYGSAATSSAQVEFSIAFADKNGSGSISSDLDYPTKALYGQYKNLLLTAEDSGFMITTGSTTYEMTNFYAISIKRADLKQKMDPGNWELHLSASSSLNLIDNSGESLDVVNSSTLVFTVYSGSIADGLYSGSNPYGLFYPDYGLILLDPKKIDIGCNSGSDSYYNNNGILYDAINSGNYFAARSAEDISSTHYFVRVKNQQYNYSTNPTFYSASDGSIIQSTFYNDPNVFITSVGLYNSSNELLAIAKLSQPVTKAFDKESLIKVRLDF